MRVHLVGMPHLDTIKNNAWCAYSQKTRRLCDMLTGQGHEVYYYGGPENEGAVKEHIIVVTEEDRQKWYGDTVWMDVVFNEFDPKLESWVTLNNKSIEAIQERLEPHDLIAITMGYAHGAVQQAFPNNYVIESGCGYEGIIDSTFHCFESYAWMHYMYGKMGVNDGRFFDIVIPNAFDPDDLIYSDKKEPYLLFMARMIDRKGLGVVTELAKRFPVVTAGQGEARIPGAKHMGVVRGKEKAELLAGASALIQATQYFGPFEGVTVEAMLSGTPAITTDWGCFAETINDGVSGARCHTLAEFIEASEKALNGGFVPKAVRNWANRYTLDAVAPQYDRWLRRLGGLYGKGWYEGA